MTYTLNMMGAQSSDLDSQRVVMPDSLAQGLGTSIYGRNGTTGLSVSAVGMTYGNLSYNARLGIQQLCKKADGSSAYYTIDTERSDPARGLIYLLPVT